MADLKEVPTEELLSFQDFPTTHVTTNALPELSIDIESSNSQFNKNYDFNSQDIKDSTSFGDEKNVPASKSFFTLAYYQQFFDIDTRDVLDRILASMIPKRNSILKNQVKSRPDLYGPIWIAITLIFTIAISGNIANYLQHANVNYHWRYDFHLVSYAGTTIFFYTTVVPLSLWGLLKWSSEFNNIEGMDDLTMPNALELVCIYGYSLFIYIPTSILWTIQLNWLQWSLVGIAAFISGSVLLFTLSPALSMSRHRITLTIVVILCHSLLAAGFMLFFFHVPPSTIVPSVVGHAKITTHLQSLNST